MADQDLRSKFQLFKKRWEILWSFYLDGEKQIEERWRRELEEVIESTEESNADLRQQLSSIGVRYHSLLREGMLIQFCSLVEYTLRLISKACVLDYEKKMPGGKGNWLKHLKLLGNIANIELDEEDVSIFQDFWLLRNCFAHVGGHIEKDSDPKAIRDIISRLQELGKRSNTDMIGETEDGYILLGTDFIPDVVARGENIFIAAFDAIC